MKTTLTTLGIFLLVLAGCAGQKKTANDFIQENIDNAVAQETLQTDIIEKSGKILNPRTINKDGSIHYVPIDDWCSGFFPGNIWYTYELTGDKKWLPLAEKYTEALDSVQYLTWHHDVGFMIGSSYLNGYRFANKEEYKPVIIQTAKSLSTRFRPGAGVIQSWDADKGWQAERGWKCPVIIDNMMNLELLFRATLLSIMWLRNMQTRLWPTTSVRTTVVTTWWIMIQRLVRCAKNKQRRATPMNRFGLADRHGLCTVIQCVIGILMMPNIWHRQKRCITLFSETRTFPKIWFLTGTSMLRRFRTSLVTLLPQHVQLLPSMN